MESKLLYEYAGSALIGFFLAQAVWPPKNAVSAVGFGRALAAVAVLAATAATLWKVRLPPPDGGYEALLEWVVVTVGAAGIAFCIGAAVFLLLRLSLTSLAIIFGTVSLAKEKATKAFDESRSSKVSMNLEDTDLYAVAAKELRISRIDEGLWAKATALANGDENVARATYLKLRVLQLKEKAKQGINNPQSS